MGTIGRIFLLLACSLVLLDQFALAEELHDIVDELSSDEMLDIDEELLRTLEQDLHLKDVARENQQAAREAELAAGNPDAPPQISDPCAKVHCGAGRICQAEGQSASCVCVPECPEEVDPRRRVCTNKNDTWASDCEVYRQRCLCDTHDTACKGPEFRHIHIDYYGECRDMPECTEEEMNDFPRRMRDWLFNVMRDLAERQELSQHYMNMELEAESNHTKRWANAAVWKWCDLDSSNDRSVSRHELFPIRAPLMSLEHCIAPFLESCDPNGDHRISLEEWGHCLEIEEGEMIEQCADINEAKLANAA
ncbi:SPARC [Phlebotomus argentipes]|uniref:SPARC n=1 Tax=Phlebotomus argentipes TaxID=94469 RepID=UPI002893076E|nr:SPARC [Phlebotomus argentipes]